MASRSRRWRLSPSSTAFAIALSVVLDRFGLLGLDVHALSWQRVVGAPLAIMGAVLVSAFR